MWWVIYIVAIVMLLFHWGRPNAIWGAATLGLIIGVIVAFFGEGFNGWTIAKSVAIATMIGVPTEWGPRLLKRRRLPSDEDDRRDSSSRLTPSEIQEKKRRLAFMQNHKETIAARLVQYLEEHPGESLTAEEVVDRVSEECFLEHEIAELESEIAQLKRNS